MTVLRFYRLSLILPVLVPSALILLFFVAPGLVTAIANLGLSMPFAVIVYSLVYGGVPYAAFAAWAAWFIGGKSEAEIRRLLLTMPL